ncbi:TRAP transporter large permease subunit [Roseovarius sp. C7]|uniref:TRAP transporter large permease subunit n=1 Tax=Roseovarius sp. C7 TaxID=3398643 RepID=UPI0039F6A410
MAVIFVLGFFLDFIEIAVVVVPIVAPILLSDPGANITAVWLGVMIGLNMQTSFLTPPFGFALFYLRGVAPAVVKTVNIYKGVIAFIGLQLLALAVVGYYPALVNYLPNRASLLSDNAPPPRNPKLQSCLEDYVYDRVQTRGDVITTTIANARAIDLSALPQDIQSDLGDAYDDAEAALAALDEAFAAQAAVEAGAGAYRPQLRTVRRIEKDVRDIEAHIDELSQQAAFAKRAGQTDRAEALEIELAELNRARDALQATIPDTWETVYSEFNQLTSAEQRARMTYRRAADGSIEAVAEFLDVLAANDAFFALELELRALDNVIMDTEQPEAEATVSDLTDRFNDLAGANEVRSALSKARRELRDGSIDRDKALEHWADAIAAYEDQTQWRRAAEGTIETGLLAYSAEISDTLGARQQSRFTREQALYIAACNSEHKDVSLNF